MTAAAEHQAYVLYFYVPLLLIHRMHLLTGWSLVMTGVLWGMGRVSSWLMSAPSTCRSVAWNCGPDWTRSYRSIWCPHTHLLRFVCWFDWPHVTRAMQIDMLIGSVTNSLNSSGRFCTRSHIVVDHQCINSTSFVFSAVVPALLADTASEGINILQNSIAYQPYPPAFCDLICICCRTTWTRCLCRACVNLPYLYPYLFFFFFESIFVHLGA